VPGAQKSHRQVASWESLDSYGVFAVAEAAEVFAVIFAASCRVNLCKDPALARATPVSGVHPVLGSAGGTGNCEDRIAGLTSVSAVHDFGGDNPGGVRSSHFQSFESLGGVSGFLGPGVIIYQFAKVLTDFENIFSLLLAGGILSSRVLHGAINCTRPHPKCVGILHQNVAVFWFSVLKN